MSWNRNFSIACVLFLETVASLAANAAESKSLCLVRVVDPPGLIKNGRYSNLGYAETFSREPYFLGTDNGGLWSLDAAQQRHVFKFKPRDIAFDEASGKVLVTSNESLFRIDGLGASTVVLPTSGALKRIRSMQYVPRLKATFILTETGLFRYDANQGLEPFGDTSQLITKENAILADLGSFKRLLVATDTTLALVNDDGAVEILEGFKPRLAKNMTENVVVDVVDMADGSGTLVVTTLGIHALRAEADRFNLSQIYEAPASSLMRTLWSGVESPDRHGNVHDSYTTLLRYFNHHRREVIRRPDALYLTSRNGSFRVHPRDGMQPVNSEVISEVKRLTPHRTSEAVRLPGSSASFEVIDSKLDIKQTDGGTSSIEGLDQLKNLQVIELHSTGAVGSILVVTDGGLFAIVRSDSAGGDRCNDRPLVEEISRAYCAVPISFAQQPQFIKFTASGNKSRVWLKDWKWLDFLDLGLQNADRFSALNTGRDTRILADIFWKQRVLAEITRGHFEQENQTFVLLGNDNEVVELRMADGGSLPKSLEVLAVVPSRRKVVVSGRDGEQSNLMILDGDGVLTRVATRAGPTHGWSGFSNVAVLDKTDEVLLILSQPGQRLMPPGRIIGEEPPRLWRLEANNSLTPILLSGNASIELADRSLVSVNSIWSLPRRQAILIGTSHGLFIYQNSRVEFVSGSEAKHNGWINITRKVLEPSETEAVFVADDRVLTLLDGEAPTTIDVRERVPSTSIFDASLNPGGDGVWLATSTNLLELGNRGTLKPVFPDGHPLSGHASMVFKAPDWDSVLVRTVAGLRMVDRNGNSKFVSRDYFATDHEVGDRFFLAKGSKYHEITRTPKGSSGECRQ